MPAGNLAKHVSTRRTPQTQRSQPDEVVNNAGGFVFQLDKWKRLERFLILGSDGGTYYANERDLTIDNAQVINDCASEDGRKTVDVICEISQAGRAPKNDPAIFAMAMLAGYADDNTRKYALANLNRVCRIGTHLFQFVDAVENFRGWGRGLRRAVGAWYTDKDANRLAYQVTKYQQRGGWSHRDVLRLAHPVTENAELTDVIKYAAGKSHDGTNRLIEGVEEVKRAGSASEVVRLITEYGLVREHVPTEWLGDVQVWEALVEKMPITAMIRNLGKMTSNGLLTPMSNAAMKVIANLRDVEKLRQGRVHPLAVLTAMKVYSQGKGIRGSLSWTPVSQISDALDDAFYASFGVIEPANKRTLIGLDVSGSMYGGWGGDIQGSPLCAAEASAAMAMVSARTEPFFQLMAFSDTFRDVTFGAKSRLDDVLSRTRNMTFGCTDCSLPMIYASENNIDVDTFMVLTDSETYAGSIKPHQAIQQYRQKTGIPAKLVVVGMTATGFSIADPNDAGMLDVVGFDTAAPNIISDFSRS